MSKILEVSSTEEFEQLCARGAGVGEVQPGDMVQILRGGSAEAPIVIANARPPRPQLYRLFGRCVVQAARGGHYEVHKQATLVVTQGHGFSAWERAQVTAIRTAGEAHGQAHIVATASHVQAADQVVVETADDPTEPASTASVLLLRGRARGTLRGRARAEVYDTAEIEAFDEGRVQLLTAGGAIRGRAVVHDRATCVVRGAIHGDDAQIVADGDTHVTIERGHGRYRVTAQGRAAVVVMAGGVELTLEGSATAELRGRGTYKVRAGDHARVVVRGKTPAEVVLTGAATVEAPADNWDVTIRDLRTPVAH